MIHHAGTDVQKAKHTIISVRHAGTDVQKAEHRFMVFLRHAGTDVQKAEHHTIISVCHAGTDVQKADLIAMRTFWGRVCGWTVDVDPTCVRGMEEPTCRSPEGRRKKD